MQNTWTFGKGVAALPLPAALAADLSPPPIVALWYYQPFCE
jgi:hypothetical protein